ncbi:rho guanine nucleotide exchange factor 28 isoform X3 [Kryptolebias marmoratus]|uniref:rho guanine nucleotide exchange factor 28 isoform X3 n=1 Tax=Kryptolebias marmoratus TaxID=37003 RepID=UPI0018ACE2AE|nr:rho guanine nucleotide exchange factor 28 isoform X3 [Kryptolebias marmoratus]
MEVNRKVPLYGQVESCVKIRERAPEGAQFYIVAQGSKLTHVTAAKQGNDDRTLYFTVPGHDCVEVVSVTAYCYTEDQVHPCEGKAYLEYLRDVPQKAAEYLSANKVQFGPQSYQEVLQRFSTLSRTAGEDLCGGLLDYSEQIERSSRDDLRLLDETITLALSSLDFPAQWKDTDRQPEEAAEHDPKESLLHVAVRLGLVHLARFIVHQPRGQSALMSPNEEGETPLQLAQRDGRHSVFRMLSKPRPSRPAVGPLPGVWCLWSDSSCMLRFCPKTGSVILTVRQPPGSCPQDAVMVLQEKLHDLRIHKLINMLRVNSEGTKTDEDEGHLSHEGVSKDLVDENLLVDSVFEEHPTFFLNDEASEEENSSSLSVNEHLMKTDEVPNQFDQHETDGLMFLMNSSEQLTQADDVKFRVGGATRDSTGTDGTLWDTEDLFLATDTPPPCLGDSVPCSLSLSSGDHTRQNHTSLAEQNYQRDSPIIETCDLSLVALEVDSEDERAEPQSPLSPLLSDVGKSEVRRETAPDLTCTRSQSASTCEPVSKELSEEGVRLRSYSYSYPKISFLPSRHPRDNNTSEISHDGVLHSVSHSRSLLQALSLSKSTLSLSLLHPGKQRASSMSDQSHEKREVRFRKRAQSADDESSMELAESLQHLTLSEFLKEIEEEELEKSSIPTKSESEKYKVIRTFSFLKGRMSSTRNKSKGKGKDREAKDRQLNGHRFASGSCLGPTLCVVCNKPASGKDLLYCSGCTVIVHKGCKESVPPCMKRPQDKYALTMPVMIPKERKETVTPSCSLSGSLPTSDSLLSESSETESDVLKLNSQSEEFLPTPVSSVSNESFFGDDCVDSNIYSHSDISADSADYESESWSLTVEHKFCKKQDKQVVKRQDVIYELMQTELHHLQILHIMAKVFRRGMKEEVQLDKEAVERVFPCLDQLLLFHHAFFAAMKERRQNSAQPQGHRNYLIQTVGDILLQQFSDENGEKMKQVYGDFCSRHNEAVSFFKDLQQHNKRFQSFIKQQVNNSLVRRREIPECILLVTQRITKYPVLLERILHYTEEETEEHANLSKALAQIREVIATVDLRVSEYERHQRLQEVWNRMENRSTTKLKSGKTFRKQDMTGLGQMLRHEGLLLWKTATGRFKDVLALLLTDTLIFLQEKDQKYTFAIVDQKPPVIPLQKLIVREVANEERGMFLISASSAGPEMYEVHTSSKEERNSWMRLIREAVESCPEEQEEYSSESEEEKRAAEARFQKILKLQESLTSQDQQICSCLEEKLQIYADLSTLRRAPDTSLVEPRLLVQPHSEELPQAVGLLAAALKEAEILKTALSSKTPPSQIQDPDSLFPATLSESSSETSRVSPENLEGSRSDTFILQSAADSQKHEPNNFKVAQSVHTLTQLLYSLQAAVTIQDSYYEVQRLLLQESGRPSSRAQYLHLPSLRGTTLLEQEKQRNLEKQKEEVAAAHQLQERLRQEKESWERERQARESQQEEQESRLEEREKQCQLAVEKLRREREELDEQLEEYQQSLERLREGQRSVERDRERLENQHKLLQTWKHGRQSSLPTVIPHMVIPLNEQQNTSKLTFKNSCNKTQISATENPHKHFETFLETFLANGIHQLASNNRDAIFKDSSPSRSRAHTGNGSVFVNEAAFAGSSFNNRHSRHNSNDPNAHNCFNTLLARSNSRQPPVVAPPHSQHSQGWTMGTEYFCSPAGQIGLQHPTSGHSCNGETWMSTASGADPYLVLPLPGDHHVDLVSLETDSDQ